MKRYSFRRVSGDSPETMEIHSTKFSHQEIRWNFVILPRLFKNGALRQNLNTRKLGEITVYCLKLCGNCFSTKFSHHEFFFSIWVLSHEHSRITGLQRKGEGIPLTPHYHFHPLYRHLDISRAITAESSPLHIASSRTRTGNLWFSSARR